MSIQRGKRRILDCRRPHEGPATVAPPIQLFNPAFAYFTSKAFDREHEVPLDFVLRVREAVKLFAVINTNESSRRERLKNTIEEILDRRTIYAANSDKTSPDGVVLSRDHLAYLVVYEEKNKFGDGNSDPSTQGAFSYLRIFCRKENRTLLLKTCCPVFIVAHAGPWLTILGGVITSKCIVQRLTDFLWVPVHSTHDDDHWLRIARIFYVLKESIGRLESWYDSNKAERLYNLSHSIPHPRFFPSVHTFSENGTEVRFEYKKPLEDDQICVTYLAETIEPLPRKIVVKFVTRYGIDAHLTMANAGFAPKLRYFGPIGGTEDAVSYGQLRMVVMDYMEGVTLSTAIERRNVPPSVETHLRQAIDLLHRAGFVFGDLRAPNVIVTPNDEIRLIDFDWAGKDGEVTYPVLINEKLVWAKGVEALGRIDKEHDRFNLDSIVAAFSNQMVVE
ncbi:hypothetical protein BKA83DRAFT_2398507 [Pisolithus microcarpus]|nr:hypothetical protein BKA83DRAFT_2398507 [Pisolithus microcarpus]